MMGLLALGLLLTIGVAVTAAVGFVTLALATLACRLMVKSGPAFGRMARTAGFLTAAFLMAVWSVNIVANDATQPDSVFAFVRPVPVMSLQNAEGTLDDDVDTAGVESSDISRTAEATDTSRVAKQQVDVEITNSDQPVIDVESDGTTSQSSLPKWVTQQHNPDDETQYHVVKSKQMVTKEEATADIHEQAATIIRDDFTSYNSAEVSWELPRQVVEDSIRRTFCVTETVELTASVSQEMHTVYAQVSVSPFVRKAIYPGWRKLVASQRLVKLGQGFGIATIVLMSIATYLRFDRKTQGKKRGRLGILSLAILASGGVVVSALGDTVKSKLSAAGIVEAGYLRDRVLLEDTVISAESKQPAINGEQRASIAQ